MTGPGCPAMAEYYAQRRAADAARRRQLLGRLLAARRRAIPVAATARGLRRIGYAHHPELATLDLAWLAREGLLGTAGGTVSLTERGLEAASATDGNGDVAVELAPGITLTCCRELKPKTLRAFQELARHVFAEEAR